MPVRAVPFAIGLDIEIKDALYILDVTAVLIMLVYSFLRANLAINRYKIQLIKIP